MNWVKIAEKLKKNYKERVVRKLSDMKEKYSDQKEVKKILKKNDPVIYKVYVKDWDEENFVGLTVMNKGDISGEYYMTKGHSHNKPAKEYYVLTKGEGKVILQNKKGAKVVKLIKNKKINIPKDCAHRTVNTGDEKLEFISVYEKDAGHNYKFKFTKRIFKK